MWTVTPLLFVNSFAASSAPWRPERNTGFVELFAIIAIVNVLPPPAAVVDARDALVVSPAGVSDFAQPSAPMSARAIHRGAARLSVDRIVFLAKMRTLAREMASGWNIRMRVGGSTRLRDSRRDAREHYVVLFPQFGMMHKSPTAYTNRSSQPDSPNRI